ncbi:gluconokinase [Hellea balneolensis]|uniref:gluconokinase n=1 Tax=Hellea balneolensis TaxID=287478 RepID=UPI000417A0A4|nr:gluconokinase [Hellea balneolensis]
MTVYILMGVAGCGKSTVGGAAAKQLNIPFLEGDDFHPTANVEKMRTGTALTNADRLPWVDAIIQACKVTEEKSAIMILACSALSKVVRDRLQSGLNNQCHFIHLHGDQEKIAQRLAARKGHFFKPELLSSQFKALDNPQDAITLDIFRPVDVITQKVCDIIQSEHQA